MARGDAGAAAGSSEIEAPLPTMAIAEQIDTLLTARFAEAEGMEDEARRHALEDLGQFASLTIEGLIEVSPSAEVRSLVAARLQPILDHHRRRIAEALARQGDLPVVYSTTPANDIAPLASAP